ncbi:MAG: SHD1 domain-containing protein [Pirellulaceae bacterium]
MKASIAPLLFLIAVAAGCSEPTHSRPPANAAATPATSEQAPAKKSVDYGRFSIAAEDVVAKFLKHPRDARFNPGLMNVADVHEAGIQDHIVVKGEVLAKNDFGGELTSTYTVLFTSDAVPVQVVLDGEIVYAQESQPANQQPSEDTFRVWMDDTLQHTIEAEFVEFKKGKVHLRKRDGSTIELSPSRLSKDDVEWYRAELKRRKSAG